MGGSTSRERWRQVQRLFAEVAGLEPERREARLGHLCRGDSQLREEVQVLLDRHARGEAIGPRHELARPSQPPGKGPTAAGLPDHPVEELFAGRYRLVEELGRGAMGVVHRARDTRLDRFVAVKVLAPHLAADRQARARLLAEAGAVAALDHPNLCTIYEVGEAEDGRLYLAMACYEGETLEARIARGPLPLADAVRVAADVARGLGAAHRHGIVHRDVKPSNVLLTAEGAAKLLDFGIAKVMGAALTRTGDTLGTAAYMSPEQLRGQVDARADLWALGAVLYEMLTGRRPFGGDYEAALTYAIAHEEPEPVEALRPEITEALAGVVRRCLEKDPAARFQTAEEVTEALASPDGARHRAPVRSWPSRRRALLIAAIAVLGLLLPSTMPGMRTAVLGWVGIANVPIEKRIAVLPFSVAGTDPSAEAFSDGLVEILASTLTQLERFDGKLWVVPTSEVRGRAVESAEEARKAFGVNLVVTGSVQRDAARVRSTLNLIDATTLRQLRSKVNEVPLSRLDALQGRLVEDLEAMLGLELGEEPRLVLTAGGTPVPGAYDYYVQGLGYLQRYESVENLNHAIRLFERALEEDDRYALAHAGLGEAYWRRFEGTQDEQWVGPAEEHAQHALALNDQLLEAHVTLGLVYTGTGRASEAVGEFEKALTIDPRHAASFGGLAKAYEVLGDTEEAEATYRRAIALKPDYWGGYNALGGFYYNQGRLEEAAEQFQRVTELTPDNARGYSNLGVVYYHLDRLDDFFEMSERSIEIEPSADAYFNLATRYYYDGRYAEARRGYEQAIELNDRDYRYWGGLGWASSWLPNAEGEATNPFEQAVERAESQRQATDLNDASILADLAGYYAKLGNRELAIERLSHALREAPEDSDVLADAATAYETLGMRAEALESLDRALRYGHSLSEVERDPGMAELRTDPRYQEMAEAHGSA